MLVFIDERDPVVLVASAVDTVDRSGSYTFAGLNFGDDFTGRTLVAVVALFAGGLQTLNQSGVTIGGVAASGTDSGWFDSAPAGTAGNGVWAAKPTGSTGSLVVSFAPGTAGACAVYLYAVSDVSSTTKYGEADIRPTVGAASYPSSDSGTLNIPAAGVQFGACGRPNNTANISFSGITERAQITVDGAHRLIVGYDYGMNAQTGRTVGFSSTGNGVYSMLVHSFD